MSREPKPAWWDPHNNRAMLICRISDRKQQDGVSLDAQDHNLREYAAANALAVAAEASFRESAKRSKHRRQFHAAIDKAVREGIRHVLFYAWDRMARNSTDAQMLEDMACDGDIVLHVVSERRVLHSGADDSEFFTFDINIAQAKQDNRNRKRKTIDGMEQRCRNGWYPGVPPQFYWQEPVLDDHGRRKRRGSTVEGPSEEGRHLVRREMELRLAGHSLDSIRATCASEGIVPLSLIRTYSRSIIDRHLKQPFYAAIPTPHDGFKSKFIWRGTEYEGKHKPIFTAVEWTRLRESFGHRAAYRKLKHNGLFAQGSMSLTCGDVECGCKITYAPKAKPSGTTFPYYRCADGRRVHRGRGEPQVNVREEQILDQFGSAVDAITLTPDIAAAIADGLNETHRAAMAAKARAADGFRAEVVALETKENRLFDLFAAGEVDRETYERQLARVRADRAERFERLQEAERDEDAKYLVAADRVLELAKRARSLWEGRSPEERRDFVARLVCNPRLDGRTVRYDLKKPFAVLAKMRGSDGWRPHRDSNPGFSLERAAS